jgi:uncharacterized protein (DUF2147 family)
MKTFLTALALVLPGASFAQDVNGVWQTQTSDTGAYLHVRIGDCADIRTNKCGVIVGVFNSDNQSIEGKPIIWAMEPAGTGKWSGGRIWAPDDDKTYKSRMSVSGGTLTVTGCVGVCTPLTSRSQNWSRVE